MFPAGCVKVCDLPTNQNLNIACPYYQQPVLNETTQNLVCQHIVYSVCGLADVHGCIVATSGAKKKTGNASPNEWDPNGKMMPLQKQKRTKIVACARELYKTSPTTPGSSDLRVSCALPSGPTLLRPASRRSPSRCAGDSFGVFHGRFETVPSTLCDRPGGGNAINFLSVEHRKWVTGRISWGDFRNSTHFWVVIWLDCYNAHSIQF